MSDDRLYYLSNHCFVCQDQDYWIILDLRSDQYYCVAQCKMNWVGSRLYGWSHSLPMTQSASVDIESQNLIESLAMSGIITQDVRHGKPFTESRIEVGRESITNHQSRAPSIRQGILYGRFFSACFHVDWRLRMSHISRTLGVVSRRRAALPSNSKVDQVPPASLIALFKKLRPWYPRSYLCLFDSLAMVEFLSRYGYFPRLILGVVADPFEAHCWLQDAGIILNDDPDRVRKYTPILCA